MRLPFPRADGLRLGLPWVQGGCWDSSSSTAWPCLCPWAGRGLQQDVAVLAAVLGCPGNVLEPPAVCREHQTQGGRGAEPALLPEQRPGLSFSQGCVSSGEGASPQE